jgi:hypothetical protein
VDPTIYNVPDGTLASHLGKSLVVRSHSPTALVRAVEGKPLVHIQYVQLLSPEADPAPLAALDESLPVDVVLTAPSEQYAELYKFSPLRERHPIRITVAITPGFSKAVRLAAALDFAVKLDVGQPDEALVEELLEVVNLYLHRPTVVSPIEFLHSVLLSFYHATPDSLWQIQEKDPAWNRYVPDGAESHHHLRTAIRREDDAAAFVDAFMDELAAEGRECRDCEYAAVCRGYFKYPDRGYDCTGVRKIFRELELAATSIAEDLESAAPL